MELGVWRNSVADEADAMIKNDTWYESELPKGKKAVSYKISAKWEDRQV